MSRFVFDTNVMVSALLLNDSVPGQAFIRGLNRGTILISTETVSELSHVLGRDKFVRYISHEKRDEFLQSLIREADLIAITEYGYVIDYKDLFRSPRRSIWTTTRCGWPSSPAWDGFGGGRPNSSGRIASPGASS